MKKTNLLLTLLFLCIILFHSSSYAVISYRYDETTKSITVTGNTREALVPVLMYHHLSEQTNDVTISPSLFENHLIAIKDAGFSTITIDDLIAYVENEVSLPSKPILITFDDGYYSNYEYAYPLLQKHNMKATIFVIGSSMGKKDFYKNTSYRIIPHFSYEEALEMQNSGLISIESHTYDMHQCSDYETGNWIRPTVSKLLYESEEHFKNAVKKDFELLQNDFTQYLNKKITAFSYPEGVYSELSNAALDEIGIKVSVSTVPGINHIKVGDSNSLKCLKRYNICEDVSVETLIQYLSY